MAGVIEGQPLVVSVPHTATRFLVNLLGIPFNNQFHTWRYHNPACQAAMASGMLIAAPMRHPHEVWRSWFARGRWGRGDSERNFWLCFDNLHRWSQEHEFHWLPVDAEDRDEYLKALSGALGRPLSTDWRALGAMEGKRTDDGLMPDLSRLWDYPFIRKFYPQQYKD